MISDAECPHPQTPIAFEVKICLCNYVCFCVCTSRWHVAGGKWQVARLHVAVLRLKNVQSWCGTRVAHGKCDVPCHFCVKGFTCVVPQATCHLGEKAAYVLVHLYVCLCLSVCVCEPVCLSVYLCLCDRIYILICNYNVYNTYSHVWA